MLSPADVGRLLAAHGIRPSKALGQHFVADPNTVRRLVRLSEVDASSKVVEIGAGLGSLTVGLAETGADVLALEVDRHLVPVLRAVVSGFDNVRVVEANALEVDLESLLSGAGCTAAGPARRGEPRAGSGGLPGGGARAPAAPRWRLVANLPYNVATPLVVRVLEEVPSVGSLLVMVQREVGDRLAAGPGDAAYGAVSVKVRYWATASVVGLVPPTVFVPKPSVESAVVRLDRRTKPAVAASVVSYERLFTVVAAGFGQRRKMLRRSLRAVVSPDAFVTSGVAPSARAEELDVEEWGRLAAVGACGGR